MWGGAHRVRGGEQVEGGAQGEGQSTLGEGRGTGCGVEHTG